jgi:hypothetical protein
MSPRILSSRTAFLSSCCWDMSIPTMRDSSPSLTWLNDPQPASNTRIGPDLAKNPSSNDWSLPRTSPTVAPGTLRAFAPRLKRSVGDGPAHLSSQGLSLARTRSKKHWLRRTGERANDDGSILDTLCNLDNVVAQSRFGFERYIGRRGGAQGYTSKRGRDIGFRSAGTGLRVLSYITSLAGWVWDSDAAAGHRRRHAVLASIRESKRVVYPVRLTEGMG